MSEKTRVRLNLAAMLAFFTQAVAVVVFLTKLDAKASTCVEEIKAIRSAMEVYQQQIHALDVRTTRLEERARISGDFIDHSKGNH